MKTAKRAAGALLALSILLTFSSCLLKDGAPASTEEQEEDLSAAAPAAGSDEFSYEEKLFDTTRVHSVDVVISEDDWSDLKANPLDKTKYRVSVTIDGETIPNVSFATKGNTSLSSVASDPDSDRYSFKINFGKYVKGQTYYGLNKLSLNNLYADATFMKDYLSYEFFRGAGVAAPLTSYVCLTVNGVDHGLYIAIEDESESFLTRTQNGEGELYKPETEALGNMNKAPGGQGENQEGRGGFPGGFDPSQGGQSGQGGFPGGFDPSQGGQGGQGGFPGGFDPSQGGQGGQGGFPGGFDPSQGGQGGFPGGMGFGGDVKGADLVYSDDEFSSYSDIFDNDETNATDESKRRVIAALKVLSEGGDPSKAVDTDEVVRYFAVHNFVLNADSYTGTMLHNYYLYENDGLLSMLPWDYNLAFGGFSGGGDATALINTGIDSPLSGTTEDARPMWKWIAENETCLSAYHEALDELISDTFESGKFEEEIDALSSMLLPYVEKDPTAFYTAEEFKTAVQTLKEFCLARAASVRAQLDGDLATVTSEQKAEDRVDASALSIRAMGGQSGGKGGFDPSQGGQGGFPGGFDPSQGGQGGFPGGFDPSQGGQGGFPGGFDPSQGNQSGPNFPQGGGNGRQNGSGRAA